MPPLEALACGVPVVIPQGVGMLDDLPDLPGIDRYTRGDTHSLLQAATDALTADNVDRLALVNAVAGHTPAAYAEAHVKGFEAILSKNVKPDTHESARHGKRGVYYVGFGDPARKCAVGAIQSFKAHLPDVEVAFAGSDPLGQEDIFVEVDDTDHRRA